MFSLLNEPGEGHCCVWHYRETLIQDLSNAGKLMGGTPDGETQSDERWAELADCPEESLWTQVRRESGDDGWALAGDELFDGISDE